MHYIQCKIDKIFLVYFQTGKNLNWRNLHVNDLDQDPLPVHDRFLDRDQGQEVGLEDMADLDTDIVVAGRDLGLTVQDQDTEEDQGLDPVDIARDHHT